MSDEILDSALLRGIENESILRTGRTSFEEKYGFGDVVTKGVPLTAAAIANSFINTPSALMRTLGMDVEPTITMGDWGFDGDSLEYYQDNRAAIEGAALVAGSFIPGMASLKLLKAAQAGKIGGQMIQASTGLFASREAAYTAKALEAIRSGEATLFTALKGDLWKAIGFGFGEQALQAAVWEVATAATMKGNYTLEDLSVGDTLWNIGKGAIVGGVIGGAINSLGVTGKIKGAFVDKELGDRVYELFDLKGQLDLLAGDKVSTLWKSMLDVSEMQMTGVQRSKFAAAERQSIGQMTEILSASYGQDKRLAYELATRMQEHVTALHAAYGKDAAADMLDRVFSGVKSISRVNEEGGSFIQPTHMIQFERGKDSFTKGLFSTDPDKIKTLIQKFDDKAPDTGIYFSVADGVEPAIALHGVHANSSKEAFDAGMHVYISKRGKVYANPNSQEVSVVPFPGRNRGLSVKEAADRVNVGAVKDDAVGPTLETVTSKKYFKYGYFNMTTGEVLDEPFKTWTAADEGAVQLITKNSMKFADNTVQEFDLASPYVDTKLFKEARAFDVSKRWAWAAAHAAEGSNLDSLLKGNGKVIEEMDLPVLALMKSWIGRKPNVLTIEQLADLAPSVRYVDETGAEVLSKIDGYMIERLGLDAMTPPVEAIAAMEQQATRRLFDKLVADGKSLEHIAIKLNLDQTALTTNMELRAGNLADYVRPTRVKLQYDISQVMGTNGNIIKGRVEQRLRMQQAYDRAETVASAFFSNPKIGASFDTVSIKKVGAENATSLGAGQGALTAANEDALTLGGRLKYLGAQVHAMKTQLHQSTALELKERFTAALKNPKAAAEIGALRAQMQRTGSQYMVLSGKDRELLIEMMENGSDFGALTSKVSRIVDGEDLGAVVINADSLTIQGGKAKFTESVFPDEPGFTLFKGADARAAAASNTPTKHTIYEIKTAEAAEALDAHNRLNSARRMWDEAARDAQGFPRRDPWQGTQFRNNLLYFPPIPTDRYPYYKFVRSLKGDVMEGGEQTVMIFGRTAEELLEKEKLIDKTQYAVLSRDEVKNYHRFMGDYSADLDMNSLFTKSDLKKSGALADRFPRMNYEEMLTDMMTWHQKADTRLLHRYVELANPDMFTQLRSLGSQWKSAMQSKFPTKNVDTMADPFDSYIKLALDIPQKDKIPDYFKWQQFAEDKAADVINGVKKMFGVGQPTAEQYSQATKALEGMGLGNPYKATLQAGMEMDAFSGAVSLLPKQYLSKFTNAVNATVATLGIRLDVIQSAINAISTPVMLVMQTEAAKLGALDDLRVRVPGTNHQLPGTSKLMYQAMQDVTTGAERKALIARYEKLGTVRAKSAEFVDLYDEIALPVSPTVEALEAKITKFAEMGAKATLSDQSEVFTRAWASRTAELLYQKLGYSGADLDSLIYTFATRVNGNHLTSQRPLIFQGWLGQSVGLYQTYQFNLLQQMFRNIQTNKSKSVLYALGMQQTLFGMQGLPGFHAINQHIIGNAAGNNEHHDLYTAVPSYFSKDVGEFLLYGGVSALTRAGVYTRGDISPRQITVLPVLPTDWPGLSVVTRSVGNILDTMKNISGGADIVPSLLHAVEHNGMNRMLQGTAQVLGGVTTTSSGSLLSLTRPVNGDMLDAFSISNAARMLGARPFDEAIALDENYRKVVYQMADSERMERLGQVVKSKLINGDDLDPGEVDEIATKYAAVGGRPEMFSRKLVSWEKDAHRSVANQAYYGAQSPISQRMQAIMGSRQLPDYRNTWQEPEAGAGEEELTPE